MKPIRIFTHEAHEHPGYFREYLEKHHICYEKIDVSQDNQIPKKIDDVSSLVFLGSPVSVNDPLSWISKELAIIKSAYQVGIPILGICFGGQLISKALGGDVKPAIAMQLGWYHTTLSKHANQLFKSKHKLHSFYAFEWHCDKFSIPVGGLPIFNGDSFKDQGFIYKNCIALQFHPEITKPMVYEWFEKYADCFKEVSDYIQTKEQILENIDVYIAEQRVIANAIFDWWIDQVDLYRELPA